MIELNSVTKIYPGMKTEEDVVALKDINLTVNAGELLMIVGPSGSGKSTLLYTMGGMLKPTSGEARLGETDIYALSPGKRTILRRDRVGFLFQTFNLIPYLSCLENAALPALLASVPKKEAMERARELLVALGLKDRLSHRPTELSVGERQRAALCRSLINQPEILLADEPTGNLDPATAAEVMKLFLDLNARGQTIVMVSHDHTLAKSCSRVVHIRAGQVQDDRLERPEDEDR